MFKTIIILLLLLTMFLFSVQCDRDLTDSLEYNHLFLEDLDYMQNLLEENFPFYGVVYRKNGVDIDSIFDNLRTTLYETNDMSEAEFNNLLIESFRPLVGSAHFNISCKFHEEHNNEVPPFVTSMIEQYKTDPHTLMQHISSIFGEDLADAFIIALQDENISDILELYELSFTIIESRDNLFTEIIEDQRIAYMSINSFFVSNAQMFIDEQKIHSFFEEIQNYEHLIIDLRNNGGGWFDYGLKLLLEPLANDTYYIDAFVFIKDGSYATAVAPP
ncbi:MAG: S41 family peptidase, partial [Oscillospiraceae bacterium]|nr:S41 family peptidase [Oscillospiraceae bacterium]